MGSDREKQQQLNINRFLLQNPLLRSLNPDKPPVREFLQSVRAVKVRRGDSVYAEGDEALCFYLVRHGEVHRFHRESDGSLRLIGIHGRGSVLGEVSFLAGERHGARAKAVLDSQLLRIDLEPWNRLVGREPEALAGLVRILSRRFHRTMDPAEQLEPARLHVLSYPDSPGRGHRLAHVLSEVLVSENHGPVLLLELGRQSGVDSQRDTSSALSAKSKGARAASGSEVSKSNAEDQSNLKDLLQRPVELFEWLRSRSHPGDGGYDHVDATPLMELEDAERDRVARTIPALLGLMRKFYSLVLVHVGPYIDEPDRLLCEIYRSADLIACARDTFTPAGPRWMDYRKSLSSFVPDFFDKLVSITEENSSSYRAKERNPDRSVPLKQNRIRLFLSANGEVGPDSPGMHRLARKLSGTLRGLCLGGGGARAYAHAGILEILERDGLEFDGISGTSMGAVIGAAHAAGISAAEIQKLLRKSLPDSDAILDKGVPTVSFFKGNRLNQVLMDVFGDLQFEDLQIPFYCNSTDLNSGQSLIFESGYISMALRASVSIPGVFPPVQMPPYTLVDGGILNNLPGNVLRERGFSRIAGINVTPLEDDRSSQTTVDFSEGVQGIMEYFSKPPVLSIITRSIAVEGRELLRFRLEDFDFILNPEMAPFDLFDFHRHDEIFEAGRKEASARLPELWKALLRH
ncbi:MAG: hypothetical protein CMN76_06060 [Spirochaetaceae bacterium]|nr:hypothetical protein [Spirochaetaceae bacterium]|tara:strand:+ start:243792 stop:245855 length:2064 start_codon:yes stop_codon:yes gene_type:complete